VPAAEQFGIAEDQVRTVMRNRRGGVLTRKTMRGSPGNTDVFSIFMARPQPISILVTIGVAAISLVVGGIVVMIHAGLSDGATKEIGIRKASARGARHSQQFLIEAVMVTALCGVIGVLTGLWSRLLIAALIGFPLLNQLASAVLGVGSFVGSRFISGSGRLRAGRLRRLKH